MTEPNILLDALIEEAHLSHAGFAARINELGRRRGIALYYDHASVARWIRDHAIPRGDVPEIICEVITARLGRAGPFPGRPDIRRAAATGARPRRGVLAKRGQVRHRIRGEVGSCQRARGDSASLRVGEPAG